MVGMVNFFEQHSVKVGSSMLLAWRNSKLKTGLVIACSSVSVKKESDSLPALAAKAPESQTQAKPQAPGTPAAKKPAAKKPAKRGRPAGHACIDLVPEDGDGESPPRAVVATKQRACAGGRGGGVAAAARRAVKKEETVKDKSAPGAAFSGKEGHLGHSESAATSEQIDGGKSEREVRAAQRQSALVRMRACGQTRSRDRERHDEGSDPSSRSSGGAAAIGSSKQAAKRAATTSPHQRQARHRSPSARPAVPRSDTKRPSSQRAAAVGAAAAVAAAAVDTGTDSADHHEIAAAIAAVDKACEAAQADKRERSARAAARAAAGGPVGGLHRKRGAKTALVDRSRDRSREKGVMHAGHDGHAGASESQDAADGEPLPSRRGGNRIGRKGGGGMRERGKDSTHEGDDHSPVRRRGDTNTVNNSHEDEEDHDAHMHECEREEDDMHEGGAAANEGGGCRGSRGGSNNNNNCRGEQAGARRGVLALRLIVTCITCQTVLLGEVHACVSFLFSRSCIIMADFRLCQQCSTVEPLVFGAHSILTRYLDRQHIKPADPTMLSDCYNV